MRCVCFINDSIGFVARISGPELGPWNTVIYKTTNGGLNWIELFVTDGTPESIFFPSDDTGYISGKRSSQGSHAMIIKTTDCGSNWTTHDFPGLSHGFSSLFFTGNEIGYCSGHGWPPGLLGMKLFKTIDGGTTWTEKSLGDRGVTSIFFLNEEIGYAVGRGIWGLPGFILKIINGGQNYISQDTLSGITLYDVHFPAVDTGYIVGSNGSIPKTTNGGVTPAGINGPPSDFGIVTISPNPSSNQITVRTEMTGLNLQLNIFNIHGEKLMEQQINSNETVLDISALPPGVYFVRVQDEKMTEVEKIIKQ